MKRIGPHKFLFATPGGVDVALYLACILDLKMSGSSDGGLTAL